MEYGLEVLFKELDSLQYKIETLSNGVLKDSLINKAESIIKTINKIKS